MRALRPLIKGMRETPGDLYDDTDAPDPLEIERTGDDSPAGSVWGYVRRMSGRHQIGLCLLGLVVVAFGIAPIELQRRLVDDAIAMKDVDLFASLLALYAGVILVERVAKFAFRVYQGWVSESAILYTRRHLMSLCCRSGAEGDRGDGRTVSIINAEVDKLGGFVGEGPSQACASAAMLIGVLSYMAWVEPRIAAFAVAFLVPQAVLTPLLQRRLNRLIEARLERMRTLGDIVASGDPEHGDGLETQLGRIFRNRMVFFFWKYLLKGLLNLLNAAGPLVVLGVGGWLVIEGETTLGVVLAFVSGFDRLAGPVRELIAFYRQAAQAEVQHAMIARWMEGSLTPRGSNPDPGK